MYIISKSFYSKRAKKYGSWPWKAIHKCSMIPRTNEGMIKFLKALNGYGKYSVIYPRRKHKGFKLIFRVNILKEETTIISSSIETTKIKIPSPSSHRYNFESVSQKPLFL